MGAGLPGKGGRGALQCPWGGAGLVTPGAPPLSLGTVQGKATTQQSQHCCQHRTAQDGHRAGERSTAVPAPDTQGQRRLGAGADGKLTLHCSTSPPDLRTAQGGCVTTQREGDTVRTEEAAMEAP